jgi:hypothetical protein
MVSAEAQTSLTNLSAGVMPEAEREFDLAPVGIWENGVGQGFRRKTESISISAGANYGLAEFGSHEAHHLALLSVCYGRMISRVLEKGHWCQGNLEFRLELFTGSQFSPESEWFVGLTPHLRYNFATGSRWIPFVDGGAGVIATSIDHPDLGGTFEFNLQFGGGVHWFIRDNVALAVESHYCHWSCAGITKPNNGLNGIAGTVGVSFFF